MVSLTGVLNGTDIVLWMFDPDAGDWGVIAGQLSSDHTFTLAPIDVSNKMSGGYRELMDGEGQKSIDHALNVIFSTDSVFAAVRLASQTGAVRRFILVRGALDAEPGSDLFEALVASFVETAPLEGQHAAAITLQSANDNVTFGAVFNDAIDANADDAIDANADTAIAPL